MEKRVVQKLFVMAVLSVGAVVASANESRACGFGLFRGLFGGNSGGCAPQPQCVPAPVCPPKVVAVQPYPCGPVVVPQGVRVVPVAPKVGVPLQVVPTPIPPVIVPAPKTKEVPAPKVEPKVVPKSIEFDSAAILIAPVCQNGQCQIIR